MKSIIGIDEAGRGALAGPLVAAAVKIVDKTHFPFDCVRDSKELTDKVRRELFAAIKNSCEVVFGVVSSKLLDRIGLQAANVLAVDHTIRQFFNIDCVLCDYIGGFQNYTCSSENIAFYIHGENRHPEIAAASIAAKVFRDNIMLELDGDYPQYGFGKHKGNGTLEHRKAIQKFGISRIHRKSFNISLL